MSQALRVRDLIVEFTTGDVTVRPLDGMTFDVQWGEISLLLGPSGSGKTTLLSVIGGLLTPQSGFVEVAGVDVTGLSRREMEAFRRRSVGFVFQSFNLIQSLTARENVAIPLILAGSSRKAALEKADSLIERFGLVGRGDRRPHELSGGQQQRVAIARGLVNDPAVLLADEPTANLDQEQTDRIIDVLGGLRSEGLAIVVSSHDPRMLPIADQIVRMDQSAAQAAPDAQRVVYEPGELIFEQGQWGELVYVVEEGEVELIGHDAHNRAAAFTTLGRGQHFGELGPILGIPRYVTARAKTRAVLTAHGVGEFRRLRSNGALSSSVEESLPV